LQDADGPYWRAFFKVNLPFTNFRYQDRRGVSAILYNTEFRQALITGIIDSPYPLFLSGTGQSVIPDISNFNIPYAAYAISSGNEAVFMDSKNQVYRVNFRRRSLHYCANLSGERRGFYQADSAAISMPTDNLIYLSWKQGASLWLVEIRNGRKGRQEDLRRLYDPAVLAN